MKITFFEAFPYGCKNGSPSSQPHPHISQLKYWTQVLIWTSTPSSSRLIWKLLVQYFRNPKYNLLLPGNNIQNSGDAKNNAAPSDLNLDLIELFSKKTAPKKGPIFPQFLSFLAPLFVMPMFQCRNTLKCSFINQWLGGSKHWNNSNPEHTFNATEQELGSGTCPDEEKEMSMIELFYQFFRQNPFGCPCPPNLIM